MATVCLQTLKSVDFQKQFLDEPEPQLHKHNTQGPKTPGLQE